MVNIVYLIYGFFAWGLLATSVCVFLVMFSPALQFLMTRFDKNKSVICVIHKGNRVSFTTGKYVAGSFETKGYGMFDETANSMYYAYRVPMYFAPEYFSHTLPHVYPMSIQGIKRMGYKILNFLHLKKIISENLEKEVKLANNQTIRMGDLLHMFPSIDDPHIREKEKASEYLIARGMSLGKDWKKYLIYVLIGGIVAFIVWKLFLTGKPEQAVNVICQYPDIVNSGVGVVSNVSV